MTHAISENTPVTYFKDHVPHADLLFKILWEELTWLRHDKVPRREYFVSRIGEPYAYGKAEYARTYQPQPTHQVIDEIWKKTEAVAGCRFDVCFLNGYNDEHDQLGWHADDSPEMDDLRPIGVVTLMEKSNEAREIWFRKKMNMLGLPVDGARSVANVDKLPLASGSMALMAPGMQDTHVHRIPKASFKCGGRISLTFRGYVAPLLKRGTIDGVEVPAPTDEMGKYLEERSRRIVSKSTVDGGSDE